MVFKFFVFHSLGLRGGVKASFFYGTYIKNVVLYGAYTLLYIIVQYIILLYAFKYSLYVIIT